LAAGWAVGDGGSVVQLSGGTWQLENSYLTVAFNALGLVNGSNGWAAAYNAEYMFYRLFNGTWDTTGQVPGGSSVYVNKIVLTPIDTGFAYGSSIWELSSGNWSVSSVVDPKTSDEDPYETVLYLGIKNNGTGKYSGWA